MIQTNKRTIDNIQKSFGIQKSKAAIGEIRDWKGGKHQKQADGSWKEVKKQKSSKKEPKPNQLTMPNYFEGRDKEDYQTFIDYYNEGDKKSAKRTADNFETFLREEIPSHIWKELGGSLNRNGERELTTSLKKMSKKDFYNTINRIYGVDFKIGSIGEFEEDDFRTQLDLEDIENIIKDEKK